MEIFHKIEDLAENGLKYYELYATFSIILGAVKWTISWFIIVFAWQDSTLKWNQQVGFTFVILLNFLTVDWNSTVSTLKNRPDTKVFMQV